MATSTTVDTQLQLLIEPDDADLTRAVLLATEREETCFALVMEPDDAARRAVARHGT